MPRFRVRGVAALLALAMAATRAEAQIPLSELAARRATLATHLEEGVFVVRGAVEPVQDYQSFHQLPGFLYFTGYREPGATLVMRKRGRDVQWTLFVQPKSPAQEVWSGQRNGAPRARELTGIASRSASELTSALRDELKDAKRLYVLANVAESGDTLNGDDRWLAALLRDYRSLRVAGVNDVVGRMRGTKSDAEIEVIRKATAITIDAHREAMQAIEPGMNEFEIQALVEYTFRRNGADRPAYASIVGSGPNATTLHYNRDDRFVKDGEVVVMDVGAQYAGYASDVTRSFPVSGRFSRAQREIYQIVRDAQAAAERNATPGTPARRMSDSAQATIAAGLARLGLIESPTATYDCGDDTSPRRCPQYQLYYMHGLGHGVGLEVHDPEQFYFTGVVARGSAFTIEPGIYVRSNLLDILPKSASNARLASRIRDAVVRYADIGVRIEDVYLVTEQGLEWASCGLPREADEVEALMQGGYAAPPPRDSVKVEWYRSQQSGIDRASTYRRSGACMKM